MKTATGLTLIAIGAILAFAVSARTPGVNLTAAGFIIMATGLTGMLMPGRPAGWLHRRIVLQDGLAELGTGGAEDLRYPAHDPVIPASQLLREAELADAAERSRTGSVAIDELFGDLSGPACAAAGWPGASQRSRAAA
jgi:hypothetical protein